jgi:hypothetical protein
LSHITIDQLTDHLLGTGSEESREQVTSHLASGCERCNALYAALARVRRVGTLDANHRPPDGVVRTVKALSGFARPRRDKRRVKMRLSFDSLVRPGLAGTRSLQASNRHLVFYSQNFALDLRMDYERSVRDVVVVGQLLNRDWGPLPDVPAYLISGDRVISHSTTGRLGEFHMECRPLGPMHLQLAVNDDELIDVELDRRQPEDLRPVLLERDDLAEPPEAPPTILSRHSDTDR